MSPRGPADVAKALGCLVILTRKPYDAARSFKARWKPGSIESRVSLAIAASSPSNRILGGVGAMHVNSSGVEMVSAALCGPGGRGEGVEGLHERSVKALSMFSGRPKAKLDL